MPGYDLSVADEQPFYAPNRKAAPPRQPRPVEPVWSVRRATDGTVFDCALLDHGAHGVDLQLFKNQKFAGSRHFHHRALALQHAEQVRRRLVPDDRQPCPAGFGR